LAEHNGLTLTWLDFDVVAGALERLLEFKLVELGVVDVFSILGLVIIVDDVHIAVTFFSHGEVFRDARGTLFREVCRLAFGKLLLGTASHQLTHQVVFVVKRLLVSHKDRLGLSIAADTELSVLHVVRPVKLDVHVVLTRFKIFVLFPGVTILSHLSILINEAFLLCVRILYLGYDESDI